MALIFRCDSCKQEEYTKKNSIPKGWEVLEEEVFCISCVKHNSDSIISELDKEVFDSLLKLNLIKPIGKTCNGKIVTYSLATEAIILLQNHTGGKNEEHTRRDEKQSV